MLQKKIKERVYKFIVVFNKINKRLKVKRKSILFNLKYFFFKFSKFKFLFYFFFYLKYPRYKFNIYYRKYLIKKNEKFYLNWIYKLRCIYNLRRIIFDL